ncbi:MAG: hypothetical protein LBR83_04600, partial [Clostridiales bacterium]|nr:hypothetical protein [Clostridiales bacterium]
MKMNVKRLALLIVFAAAMCFLFPNATVYAQASGVKKIVSLTSSADIIGTGGSVVLTAVTSPNVTNVIVEYNDLYYRAAQQGADEYGNLVWSLECKPALTQVIIVYANTMDSLYGASFASKRITVTPTPPVPTPAPVTVAINGITPDKEVVYQNDYVTYTVSTNLDVNNVWLKDGQGRYILAKQGESADPNVKVWAVSLRADVDQVITINANKSYTTTGMVSQEISVVLSERPAEIYSARLSNTDARLGDAVTVTVRTNAQTEFVWVAYDGKTEKLNRGNQTAQSKNWSLSINPQITQDVIVYANAVEDVSTAVSFALPVNVSEKRASITSAKSEWRQTSTYQNNTELTLTVITNDAASYVWAEVASNTTLDLRLDSTDRNGNKTWSLTYSPYSYSNYRSDVTVNAGVGSRTRDDYRTIQIAQMGKIHNV